MKKKILISAIVALSLALLVAVGGTIAWLIDSDGNVVNTFTPSNVDVEVWEHDYVSATNTLDNTKIVADNSTENNDYKMIPGTVMPKDPTVTVNCDIPCYVYVRVTENIGITGFTFDDYLSYAPLVTDSEWKVLAIVGNDTTNASYVLYREVAAGNDQKFSVLTNNQITVNGTVTKQHMDALGTATANYPSLTFEAFVIQKDNTGTAEEAWAKIVP